MVGRREELPLQPDPDSHIIAGSSSRPVLSLSKNRLIIITVVILLVVVLVGVLCGVLSDKYAVERTRREFQNQQKGKHDGVSTTAVSPTTKPNPLGPEPWYKVRLPTNVIPVHYDLFLHPNLTTGTFEGEVEILVDVLQETEYILVHTNGITVSKSSVHEATKESQNEPLAVKEMFEYKENFYYVFIMSEKLSVGRYIVRMDYRAPFSSELNGFYLSTYKDKRGTRKLATTKFEPTDARKALPCFDEPAMKATFTTTIVHEPDYTALTNMPEAINKTRSDGLIETRFMKSVPMSTYLLAFIVCDFKHTETITGEHNNVTLRVWTTPDQINQTYFALDEAEKIITYFEKYYKVMYPLPKQDLIAIPDFSSGAMENWGLITFRETALLYQPRVSSESNKQRVAVVVSHELAHQWFGNIVSPKWWNDLWLNEGFASYVEYLGVNHTHPDWQMLDQFLLLDLQLVLPLDSLATSHPISVEVDHPKKIKQIFDRISYSKGSSIIRMLAGFLGDDLFTDGLQHYLKKFAFKNAETKDLWEALGETSKTDVKTIMDTWTLQMGFPVVKVGRVGDSNKARLTQKHFLLDPGANVTIASPYGYKWYIPFTYVTQTSPQSPRLVWMNMSSAEIQIPPLDKGWVKGNYQQIGYYRVHYDDNNWRALVAQLNQDHEVFTSQDRSSLLNDAFSLARAGYLKYDIAMSMLTYLDKERSYVPWKTALNALSYLKTVLANRPSYGNLQKFIRGRLAGLANELGWEMKASDSHIDRYLRGAILGSACSVGLPEAVGNASRIFKEWQTGERASISVDLRSIVYRYGIAATGPDEWDWMFARYQASMDASEKISLLEALGHSKQTWILNKLLASSLNSSIVRTQDTISVILSVAGNPVGKYLAWNFVRANWENLLKERRSTSSPEDVSNRKGKGSPKEVENGKKSSDKGKENWEMDSGTHDLENIEQLVNQAANSKGSSRSSNFLELANTLHLAALASLKSEIVELSGKLQNVTEERDSLQTAVDQTAAERQELIRDYEDRLQKQQQQSEEQITELQSVIAELNKKHDQNDANKIDELDEIESQTSEHGSRSSESLESLASNSDELDEELSKVVGVLEFAIERQSPESKEHSHGKEPIKVTVKVTDGDKEQETGEEGAEPTPGESSPGAATAPNALPNADSSKKLAEFNELSEKCRIMRVHCLELEKKKQILEKRVQQASLREYVARKKSSSSDPATEATNACSDCEVLRERLKTSMKELEQARAGNGSFKEERDRLRQREVMRKFRGILNKLTPQKFKKLTEQAMELEIDTSEKLEGIIDIIFEKAISEPGFSVAYANLCRCLLPIKVSAGNKELVFRTILLNKCQKEFEKKKTDKNRIHEKIYQLVNEGLSEEDYKIKKAELEEEEMFGKRRKLGYIRFIGELFKLKILTENIMHTCVMKLIKSMDEESLECFCKLLSTIGKNLDHEAAKPRMDQYFSQMDKIIASKKTSSRVRFMLQDLRDLRLSNWVPRRDDNNPKTIDQIHKDEEKKTQLLLQQQPKMPKNKGRDSPRTVVPQADETWTTVSSRGPRNVSVDPKKFQNVQKRNVDSENISLGPGGRGYGAWARGSSGGTGPVAATQAAQPEEPRGNRFSALGGEARRGPGAARPSSGAGRQEPRSPGPPGRWPPASEREKALEAARNLGQPKSKPERKDAPSPEPEPEEEETSAPAPEPPAAKEFSEREVEQKVNSIIDEYHNISDLKEAMECIQEMKSPSMHHKVVFYAINHSMEKHQNERLKTGRLLRALVKSNIISKEQFMEGLDEMLEFTEDYEIDIPHVYNYLGHMVGPACCDGVLPLTDISQSACKLFSKKNNCARLIAELLLTAKSESSSADVAELWAQLGINFSSFFESEDAAQQFIKKMKLESLLTSPPIAPSSSHHSANVQEELRELMLKKKASNQEVFNWIDGNVQNTKDPQFIRAIVTVVCESCKTDDGDSFKCDKVKLANRKNLLQKYIDSDSNLELQALYALQSLTEKLDHPSGFLRSYFEDFYDEDIVQEEAFYAWEKSTDPAEQTGKGTAQASTQRFFEWLRSAEEEPAKDA